MKKTERRLIRPSVEQRGRLQTRRRRLFWISVIALLAWLHMGEWLYLFRDYTLRTPGIFLPYRIMADLAASSECAEARKAGEASVAALLDKPAPSSLHEPALGDDSRIAHGRLLPRECYYDAPQCINAPYYRDGPLDNGRVLIATISEYRYYAHLSVVFMELSEICSPAPVLWMAERADVVPPERLDVLATWTYISPFLGADDVRTEYRSQTRDAFRRMAHGRNPIYRLCGVGSVEMWAESEEEKNQIYLRALEEENTVFYEAVLTGLKHKEDIDPRILEKLRDLVNDPTVPDNDGTVVGVDGFPSFRDEARKILESHVMNLTDGE